MKVVSNSTTALWSPDVDFTTSDVYWSVVKGGSLGNCVALKPLQFCLFVCFFFCYNFLKLSLAKLP